MPTKSKPVDLRKKMPTEKYKVGDYVKAKRGIRYPTTLPGHYDVEKGDVGKVEKVLPKVSIQEVQLFCEHEEFSKYEKGFGHSTFLDIIWLTGTRKGKCLTTHKSNVRKISEQEAMQSIKAKR